MKIRNILMMAVLVSLFACKPELDDFTTTSGDADFSKYVALGNSLTAGYADAELYRSGQENSYPAILAMQFEAAGGGDFKQPLMLDELGFGSRLLLDASLPGPVPAGGTPDPANMESIAAQGPFNNMGVPGAKTFHLITDGYGALNPYYGRFASSATASVLADAAAQQPTFFTCWIGANDVLTYAIAGGAADSITDINTFGYAVDLILQQMTAGGAKGAIANIPDITSIPYFTFMNTQLQYNFLTLTEQAQVDALNQGYAELNEVIKSLGSTDTLAFSLGQNPFVIVDKSLPWGIRQMNENDLFLLSLPTDSVQNHGYGSQIPIPDDYVLSTNEQTDIQTAIDAYNVTLANLATTYDLAFVDMRDKLMQVATGGIEYDGINFTSEFISGNAFSLDGVHLTAQGYAMTANFFIDAINSKYGSQLTHVSPRLYPGIYYYE